MTISPKVSCRISLLSLLGAVLVVFLHSYSPRLSLSISGSITWWVQDFVSQGFARIAVPYFLMVFGFMLYKDFNAADLLTWWGKKVRSRAMSIAVPYVLWCAIGTFIIYVLTRFAVHQQATRFLFSSSSWWLSTFGIIEPPTFMFHLWFLRTVMVFVACAPLIGLLFLKIPVLGLSTAVICAFLGVFDPWASSLFYVGLGAVLAIHGAVHCPTFGRNSVRYSVICLWVICVTLKVVLTRLGFCDLYGRITIGTISLDFMMIINTIGLLAYWHIGGILMRSAWITALFSCNAHFAFFIYCIHWIFLAKFSYALSHLYHGVCYEFVMWFTPPLFALMLSMCLGKLGMRFIPRFYKILSGGR